MALRRLLTPRYLIPGLTVYAGAVYGTYRVLKKPEEAGSPPPAFSSWNDVADFYDDAISKEETFMLMGMLRRRLLSRANGAVLEVCAGTGRNLGLYPDGVSVVLTDTSPGMLEKAAEKVPAGGGGAYSFVPRVDASRLPFEDNTFDSVVQTFGLCSTEDAAQALSEMQRVCRPGGTILLLEHGRSGFDWLNTHLDAAAANHHSKWGCWWNKNIESLLSASGLTITALERWHFGTTFFVVASPGPVE